MYFVFAAKAAHSGAAAVGGEAGLRGEDAANARAELGSDQ